MWKLFATWATMRREWQAHRRVNVLFHRWQPDPRYPTELRYCVICGAVKGYQ